jgi:hypothetical protein
MSWWLGILGWHLLPVFYKLNLTATNKKKTYKLLPPLQNKPKPQFIIKEYQRTK